MRAGVVQFTRTSQPQTAVGVDWGNPLTRGLLLASIDGTYNAAQRVFGYDGGSATSRTPTGFGIATQTNGANWRRIDLLKTITVSEFTAAAFGNGSSATGDIIGTQGIGNTPVLSFGAGANSDSPRIACRDEGGGSGTFSFTTRNVWNGSNFGLITLASSGTTNLYLKSGLVETGSCYIGGTSVVAFGLGCARPGSTYESNLWTGKAACYLFWDRALTSVEAMAVAANPWQLFAPIQRRIWVPGAAGAAPSYSPPHLAQTRAAVTRGSRW
jgi:hypothetical protein